MKVELISVGTELLLGNIINTNAAYLSEQCALLGLSCYHQSVVGDNEERLCEAILKALERSDILILSGGLGPTKDDLTKECVAKVWDLQLVRNKDWEEYLKNYFQARKMSITENNWKQADVFKEGMTIENENGTAPGLIVEKEGKHILLLPGPPMELIPMFEKKMIPYLKSLQTGVIYSRIVKLCGIGESKVETEILDLIERQENPTIAPYAKTGEVHLRITAKADSEEEAAAFISPVTAILQQRFGNKIYTMDEAETLEMCVLRMLKERNLKLGLAESCTGGLLAGRITSVSGASDVFTTGLVTYANEAKEKLLGVQRETLQEQGAVSAKTAEEMVEGLVKGYGVTTALSITGIAGPTGGSEEKPVGLVYIGCRVPGKIKIKEYHFSGSREKIRQNTLTAALILLRSCLLEENTTE